MATLYNNAKGSKPHSEREILQNRYDLARRYLLAMIIFTTINVVLIFYQHMTYFPFIIFVPYFLAVTGMMVTGKLPKTVYPDEWAMFEFFDDSVLILLVAIIAVVLLLYLLCWFFSGKNKAGWLVFALVLFSIDMIVMLFLKNGSESIVHVAFRVLMMIGFVSGITACNRLKKLSDENVEETVEETVSETVVQNQNLPRIADMDVKAKILLQTEQGGLDIVYRRVKTLNELVINGNVYDEYEGFVEYSHNLTGVVGGRTIEAGLSGVQSYIKIDGELIAKKIRLI